MFSQICDYYSQTHHHQQNTAQGLCQWSPIFCYHGNGITELAGKTFLFTGALPTLKRKAAEEMAEAKGGKILSGVSTKLDYLIAGEKAGSKLEKAKKLGSVNIISEEEFIEMVK